MSMKSRRVLACALALLLLAALPAGAASGPDLGSLLPGSLLDGAPSPASFVVKTSGAVYEVMTSEALEDGVRYPAVYVLPEDGTGMAGDARAELEKMADEGGLNGVIIVFPQLSAPEALHEELAAVVAEVDAAYPTIPDAEHRALLGFGIGGDLALRGMWLDGEGAVREKPELFGAAVCHAGSFTADVNPLAAQDGLIYDILNEAIEPASEFTVGFYTYIDGPQGDPQTIAAGGTGSLARLFRLNNAVSFDYGAFEYAVYMPEHWGSTAEVLSRGLAALDGFFGNAAEEETAAVHVDETVPEGPQRRLDLMGDWHFLAYRDIDAGGDPLDDAAAALDAGWDAWGIVQPGTGWWEDDTDASLGGSGSFAGYAWYIREFEVPDGFDCTDLTLDAGMMDEADEIYLNGTMVGSTGMTAEGNYDGSNPWDVERVYAVPDGLLSAGVNTMAVRVCNSSGGGGWYAGPILIYANTADIALVSDRMTEVTLPSAALGQDVTAHIYLPEGYEDCSDRYPVTYMLHGYGSTGRSFEIAGVPALLDEAIADGAFPPCIVVCPDDPTKSSFWSGAAGRMVIEDLIPWVDANYRTVADREHRGIAGESMGGGGAYRLLMEHMDLFSWIFDIYGALDYAEALPLMMRRSGEELSTVRQYFIAGNHDSYTFDLLHLLYDAYLTERGVEHRFEVAHGEHSSTFYLHYIREGFAWCLADLK